MCLYPRLIKNRKYTATKKNGGKIPAVPDERVKYVAIGCQKCIECRKQKSRSWQARLLEDIKTNTNGKFITLTFSDESITNLAEDLQDLTGYNLDNAIATKATRLFLERVRKHTKKSVRHWLVTELGHNGTHNIHLHGIIWSNDIESILKHWKYGYTWSGNKVNGRKENYVTEKTIGYITKYVTKIDKDHKGYEAKILTSPGIGSNYTNRRDAKNNSYKGTETNQLYKTKTGHTLNLPIYWRNKIYTEKEREKLWIQLLDKKERWIRGERVDVSTEEGWIEYYKLLEYHRAINKELGYGDDTKNWEKIRYEQQQRNLKINERIAKGMQKIKKQ